MSSNIKIEPFEESSSIVDLSSDEDDLVSEQIEIPEFRPPTERPGTSETNCSICYEELTNKCHSDSCWHLFCFECLKRWSGIQSSCPICRNSIKTIHHTLSDTGKGKTYEVPIEERELSSSREEDTDVEITGNSFRTIEVLDSASRDQPSTSTGIRDSLDRLNNRPRIFLRPFDDIADVNSSSIIFRTNLFLDNVERNERMMNNIHTTSLSNLNDQDHNHNSNFHTSAQFLDFIPSSFDLLNPYGTTMRIRVYIDNVWAEPLTDLSQFRDCTLTFYRNNPTLLREFIARDITAIISLWRPNDVNRSTESYFNVEFITNLVIQSVPLYEIRDPIMTGILQPYLGDHAAHFCHELYNFANSPYNIIAYDSNVRYSNSQGNSPIYQQPGFHATDIFDQVPAALPIPGIFNHSETIIQDSDDEVIETGTRRFTQEIIVISSSSEDSDVEITGHSFRPIEVLDSSSRDQPSTSTGIQDSLGRQNNRYNQLAYSPSLRTENIVLDSSSSDESITSNRDSQGVIVYGRRKRKNKKSKHKKRKSNSDDTRPEILLTGTRNRSYSGSSSSSDDTDSSPNNNNCVSVQTNMM